jgi:GNAT superfamily N-acetyltransferase
MNPMDRSAPSYAARIALPGGYTLDYDLDGVDWEQLSEMYRVAPLGDKRPDWLKMVYENSMFRSLVYTEGLLVGAGRALADGLDAAYLADIAVHPEHQGRGLGLAIVRDLVRQCTGHRKIILYANPGTEPFYRQAGFLPMETAMAVWRDPATAIASGFLRGDV